MNKRKLLPIFLFITLLLFLTASATVQASIIKDFVEGVKDVINPQENGELVIESEASFAKDGDKNDNQQYDGGDIVTFTYKIDNRNGKVRPFSKLLTKIPTKSINYIHNLKGVSDESSNTK